MKNNKESVQNTSKNLDSIEHDWRNIKFSHPERTICLGTSFSGIGAIEHAFKRLGLKHKIMFAGDIDDDCKKSYFANYDIKEEQWHKDITYFDAKPFKNKIDLFVGGAPCQAFSMRGKRGGFDDTRGTLFREFARVVIESQPKIFIFENVKGMLSHDSGNTWKVIKDTFENECNYKVFYQVLNGKNYGVPQNRERLYCIGFKNDVDFIYPTPIPLETKAYNYLDSIISHKYFLKQKGVHFITEHINREKKYTQINGNIILCQKRNQQFNWHGDFIFHPLKKSDKKESENSEYIHILSNYEEDYYKEQTPGAYALISSDNDTYTLSPCSDCEVNNSVGRFRKLTPRECLRLMGFEDSFNIVVSDTTAYKQAGNSIIVNVLMALLKQMDITKYGTDL